jgi:3-phenylpropionate/cinnamic acid dioxygenase small subunit
MSACRERVENFLYREARLMDEHRYLDWLALFDDPCTYWIPSNKEEADPSREVSILYADRSVLATHVKRLADGKAFAQSPPSRLRRLVSNIEINDGAEVLRVFANFSITEVRRHVQRVHGGRSEYTLTKIGNDLRIAFKKVSLVGIDEHLDNVTFLL